MLTGSTRDGSTPSAPLLGAALALTLVLGGCGEDERTSAVPIETVGAASPPATTDPGAPAAEDEQDLYPDVGPDEPFTLVGQVMVIELVEGSGEPHTSAVVLYVNDPEGRPHRVVVPSDLALDGDAERVLRDESCSGKVDAELEVVETPPGEELGDLLLIGAETTLVDC